MKPTPFVPLVALLVPACEKVAPPPTALQTPMADVSQATPQPTTAITPSTLFACYISGSGVVYRIQTPGAPDACHSSVHVQFSWNEQGPAGPAGPPGPPGPPGPTGPAATTNVQYISAQAEGVVRAFCPAGTKVTGGGGSSESTVGGAANQGKLHQSFPISDATGAIAFGTTAIGWQVASSDPTDVVVAFAICASP